jgi:hypothetical protein
MMQAAESCVRDYSTAMHGADSAARRFLVQPQMRAVFVVVTDIFTEKAFQMPLVEHDYVVEQVAPTTL